MARPIRVEFAGAVYHVMARGNERRAIFRDDRDRRRCLDTIGEAVGLFGLRVHAYCLLGNHYHALVGTPRGNLSQAWGWVQETYAVRFNRRHRRSGHLFQGRFRAVVVEADEYARWLVEYIHLNPVRPRQKREPIAAQRAGELAGYAWSSHRDYAGLRARPEAWLCLEWLRYWGRTVGEAQAAYRESIGRAFGRPASGPWDGLRGGLVLGSADLWEKVRGLIGGKRGLEEAQWTRVQRVEVLRAQTQALLAAEGDKRIRIWVRVRLGGEARVAVGRAEGYRDGSGVTHLIRALEARAAADRPLRKKLDKLQKALSCFKS